MSARWISDCSEMEMRVARGAALLDHAAPGWHRCLRAHAAGRGAPQDVLRQLYGSYYGGLATLFVQEYLAGEPEPVVERAAVDHGFLGMYPADESGLVYLWHRAALGRRATETARRLAEVRDGRHQTP